jgi:hypothetical protein
MKAVMDNAPGKPAAKDTTAIQDFTSLNEHDRKVITRYALAYNQGYMDADQKDSSQFSAYEHETEKRQ